ncbi:ThiF family adenylyltransferase [Bacillus solimangrovi]|uniref:Thiamine biosynthesis protein MoeB n=1 Tax=Bacillus solimangrovi TaxID=1305675 RepID=A0A1E5LFX0_9BACI|nr:ThiF family adenylyltransferase [Bacillus solimangrovi]OEH92956.1 thiamine biosynthesis protein MoeB [Bacillus solimangrovi]
MNDRYSRQTRFSDIGEAGQVKLTNSHVLIVGAGALGTSIAEMLTRAGVGKLTIIDRDYVEWSNLQRQQLYTEADAKAGTPKALAASKRLNEINHEVVIEPIVADFFDYSTSHSLDKIDLIMDATDNFETRFLINDLAQKHDIPWIYGGATGSTGITYTIIPNVTPCLTCMSDTIPTNNETCDTVGVISPIIQWVTAHQVNEAMKLLTGNKDKLRNTLLYTDLWKNHSSSIKMESLRKVDCPSCGEHASFPYLNHQQKTKLAVLCGRDTIQIRPAHNKKFDRARIERNLSTMTNKVAINEFIIHAHLSENKRVVIFSDGRVLLHGTKDVAEAESLYEQLIYS